MKLITLAGLLILICTTHASSGVAPLPGARVTPACRTATIPYPQNALAAGAGSLWIACRDAGRVERRTAGGRLLARIATPGLRPWSVAAIGASVFVVDRDQPLLLRISARSNRIVGKIQLREPPLYVWAGAGFAWLAFDGSGTVARVDAQTGKVGRPIAIGAGPAGFASSGGRVWIAAHRDGALARIQGAQVKRLSSLAADEHVTPERMTFVGDSLWVTGRGLDLLRVDAETGAARATTEIGAAGIDVLAVGERVAAIAATATGARRGDPLAAAVVYVDPTTGTVTRTLHASSVSVLGAAALGGRLALLDGLHGRLLLLPQ